MGADEYDEPHQLPAQWEELRLADPLVAGDVLGLVVGFPDWVHRRKEQVEIRSETHVRWRSSLDLTVPSLGHAPFKWLDEQARSLVPLDLLDKQPLTNFDLRDESGGSLPTLTRRQNATLAGTGICTWGSSVVEAAGVGPISQAALDVLRQIVSGDADTGSFLISCLQAADGDVEKALCADLGFMAMLQWLSSSFMLITPLDASPGARRVVKYTYECTFAAGTRVEARPRRTRVAERLGLSPTAIYFPVPMFRDCESFHFEAESPPGTHFVEIALVDLAQQDAGGEVNETHTAEYKDVSAESPHLAHLSVSRTVLLDAPPEQADPDDYLNPTVIVTTRLDRAAWLRSALLAIFFVTVFLWATYPYAQRLDDPAVASLACDTINVGEEPAVVCIPASKRVNTDPAALMVGLVGVISLAVIRSGEHAYTAKVVRPLRYVAMCAALLPIAGAWLLVFPGPGRLLADGWLTLAVLATGATVLFIAAYIRPKSESMKLSQQVGTTTIVGQATGSANDG